MEFTISILALATSFISIGVSIIIYIVGISRERKRATLDAYNLLQEQAFDCLNHFSTEEIKKICEDWKNKKNLSQDDYVEVEGKYITLVGILARIEHFSLGVNTKIYDLKTAERAGTKYLSVLYKYKLKALLELKQENGKGQNYYTEYEKLVDYLEKIENNNKADLYENISR